MNTINTINTFKNLENLFCNEFSSNSFFIHSKASSFNCPLKDKCKINVEKEACYTPLFGDEDTKIMLVGEAPSARGKRVGPYIGGMFKDINDKNLSSIRDLIKTHYNTVPYFTDLMKCGVEKQTREMKNNIFQIRTENCFEHFLIKEIEIIKPERIFCIGWRAFSKLNDAQNKGLIDKNIELKQLLHYATQANLTLTSEDKLNYIWPTQIGVLKETKLTDLNFFKKGKG